MRKEAFCVWHFKENRSSDPRIRSAYLEVSRSAGLHNTSSHALRISSSPLTPSKIKVAEVITDTCQNLNSDEDEGKSQQPQQLFTQAFISQDLEQEMSLILSTLPLIISHLAPISWMFSGDNLHEINQCLSRSQSEKIN